MSWQTVEVTIKLEMQVPGSLDGWELQEYVMNDVSGMIGGLKPNETVTVKE